MHGPCPAVQQRHDKLAHHSALGAQAPDGIVAIALRVAGIPLLKVNRKTVLERMRHDLAMHVPDIDILNIRLLAPHLPERQRKLKELLGQNGIDAVVRNGPGKGEPPLFQGHLQFLMQHGFGKEDQRRRQHEDQPEENQNEFYPQPDISQRFHYFTAFSFAACLSMKDFISRIES